jgi:hypothetical protein
VEAQDRGYKFVEHFKMHLHPKELLKNNRLPLLRAYMPSPVSIGMSIILNGSENLALHDIPLKRIYADFLTYLLAQTRRHLRDCTGSDPWPEMAEQTEIVLSHPNRWGESQQKFLQQAVIAAGLVSEKGASERLVFIEEGEASASFCMSTNNAMAAKMTVGGFINNHMLRSC